MTKEKKVLWAMWMASTDIWEYAVDVVLDFTRMDSYELNRIWDNGLRLTAISDLECIAYPIKSRRILAVMVLTPREGTLVQVRWDNPDELDRILVEELKRVCFTAPWVSGMEVGVKIGKRNKNACHLSG